MHPLAVALSVACGTLIADVIGAVVAVPMVAVAWTVRTAFKAHPSGGALPSHETSASEPVKSDRPQSAQ